jgi:hypothetical protein
MDRAHAKETEGRYIEVGTGLRSPRGEKMRTPQEDLEEDCKRGSQWGLKNLE